MPRVTGKRRVIRRPRQFEGRAPGTFGGYGTMGGESSIGTGGSSGGANDGGESGGGIIIDPENPTTDIRCTESGETRITEGGVERRIDG